jgi:DedD protein
MLKQRLVGALILVALGVVFWPIIFLEPENRPGTELASIPPRPGVETTPIEPPDQVGLRPSRELRAYRQLEQEAGDGQSGQGPSERGPTDPAPEPEPEPAEAAAPVAAAAPPATRSTPPEQPAIDAEGVPVAWVLQVASMSSASKAEALRQQLLQFDQKAYVKKVRREGRDLYRVYVGPKFERARLDAIKVQVDARFRVESVIMRYLP